MRKRKGGTKSTTRKKKSSPSKSKVQKKLSPKLLAASKQVKGSFVSISEPYFKVSPDEFVYELKIRKRKKGKIVFESIKSADFIPGRYYRIYMRNRIHNVKRLLGFGIFTRIPDKSTWSKKRLGGRTFQPIPQPRKSYRGWVPTWTIASTFEDEVNARAKEEKVEARSSIIPMRRWYHPDYKIFSDNIIKNVSKKVKAIAISVLSYWDYSHTKWVQKSTVVIKLDEPIALSKFHTMEDDLMKYIKAEFQFRHTAADDIVPLQINGYIPLEYSPREKGYGEKQ